MEEPIDINKIKIEDKFIKLSAEDENEFKLKKCTFDELGNEFEQNINKYRYFKKMKKIIKMCL